VCFDLSPTFAGHGFLSQKPLFGVRFGLLKSLHGWEIAIQMEKLNQVIRAFRRIDNPLQISFLVVKQTIFKMMSKR
jgi:hypothetical protein